VQTPSLIKGAGAPAQEPVAFWARHGSSITLWVAVGLIVLIGALMMAQSLSEIAWNLSHLL
jgi:hypothetical protein